LNSEPLFIVDTMLGNVARWLRILGYDTKYDRGYKDWEILKIARDENRVVITRDKGLHNRALNNGLKSIYLEMDDMAERLAYISLHVGIRLYVDLTKSRCPICNGELIKIGKDQVKDKVPQKVYRLYSDFWKCTKCGKIYWIGGHWVMIENILNEARKKFEEYNSIKYSIKGGKHGETHTSK